MPAPKTHKNHSKGRHFIKQERRTQIKIDESALLRIKKMYYHIPAIQHPL